MDDKHKTDSDSRKEARRALSIMARSGNRSYQKLPILLRSVIVCRTNFERVYELIAAAAYIEHQASERSIRIARADVRRAAIVLAHAALEEFVRAQLSDYLMNASPKVLSGFKKIRYPGEKNPEKQYVSYLSKFRGRSVDQVLDEAIQNYVERKTFNSFEEIVGTLTDIGVDTSALSRYATDIDDFLTRRHKIVHVGDRSGDYDLVDMVLFSRGDSSDSSCVDPDPLDVKDFSKHVAVAARFVGSLIDVLVNQEIDNVEDGLRDTYQEVTRSMRNPFDEIALRFEITGGLVEIDDTESNGTSE